MTTFKKTKFSGRKRQRRLKRYHVTREKYGMRLCKISMSTKRNGEVFFSIICSQEHDKICDHCLSLMMEHVQI